MIYFSPFVNLNKLQPQREYSTLSKSRQAFLKQLRVIKNTEKPFPCLIYITQY